MITVNVYTRNTRRYRAGWAGEDDWSYLTTVKLTPPRITAMPEDLEEGPTYVQHCKIPKGINRKLFVRSLIDTISGSSCKHSHDCCGCAYRYASVRLNRRNAIIHTSVHYNY